MSAMRNLLFALLSSALLLPWSVSAAVLDSLYQVTLVQEEEQSRDQLLQEATRVMLTRLAGAQVNLEGGSLAQALQDPRALMRRVGSPGEGLLEVEFEPSLLRSLLADAGVPMLGRNRPAVLLWAVEAGTLGDELVGQEGAWAEKLKVAAQHRGVALSFPLADLQDRSLLGEEDIRQARRSSLLAASERYAAEGTLALAIDAQGDGVRLSWSFWLNDQSYSGRIDEAGPEQAADALMQALAKPIFEQYAVAAVGSEQLSRWTLVVRDVGSLDSYAGLQRLLEQLGSQSAPQLLAIEGDQVTLTVEFPGSEAQLERMLSLDRRLQRVEAPALEPQAVDPADIDEYLTLDETLADLERTAQTSGSTEQILYYRWR